MKINKNFGNWLHICKSKNHMLYEWDVTITLFWSKVMVCLYWKPVDTDRWVFAQFPKKYFNGQVNINFKSNVYELNTFRRRFSI